MLDWLERGDVEESDASLGNPIEIASKAGAALIALLALPSSPLVTMLVPEINSNALIVLQGLIGVTTLGLINYVVTAKDLRTERAGLTSRTVPVYRYTRAERIVARLILVLAIAFYSLNLVPPPADKKNCDLFAKLRIDNAKRPLTLLLLAGDKQTSYSLVGSSDVAITIPAASVPSYTFSLVWEGGSRSEFDKFSGCIAPIERASKDGQATISFSSR
ncbi:hypothetical protein [Sinorhizobium meliloti]|uniref:hypothetical protein n=1 Tax=Rhizobium meliloti TaxID=382 RepID=UPI00238038A0|nr:hypothetical protein [Sinorhizobium meliloti]MDE3819696.1 hypothetical protein [Sinorhizobium meliloti]